MLLFLGKLSTFMHLNILGRTNDQKTQLGPHPLEVRCSRILKHAKSEVRLRASGTHAAQVARVGSTPAEKMLTTLADHPC